MNTKLKFLLIGTAVLGLILVVGLAATRVTPVLADTDGCPESNSLGNRLASNLVGAYFTTRVNAVTYYFSSFVDRSPVDGVPGLIKYCIYSGTAPDSVTTVAVGANGGTWVDDLSDFFAFGRPDGDPSNIPLNGVEDIEMGTATWSDSVPTSQTILLHINDAAECDKLYGGNPGTCFVLPGEEQPAAILSVTKTATPSFTRTFGWTIEKSADYDQINTAGSATFNYTIVVTKDSGTDSDWAVAGTITVYNPNTFDVNGVDVSDATPGGVCNVTGSPLDVPALGNASASYICTFTSNPGSGTNTATATRPDIGSPSTSATGTADYSFGDPTTVVNDEIDVTDTNGGSWHFTDSGSVTYPITYDDPAGTCTDHTNVATITQTDQTADKTVTVCVGADLTVSKTATPTFTRTYLWDISKAVDPTLVEQFGGTATFNYTVNVNQTGFTDSLWAVAGMITVTNPNDWEAITFNASDALPDADCIITGGSDVVLAAGASVDLPYTCTFAAQPPYNTDLTNTATATWDSATYYTPDGSASGTAVFQFTTPTTTVNKTVTITDTFNGVTTTLGTLTATDEPPYASATFTYSRIILVPTWDCVFYPNTATIVETNQSASQTVEVCGPANTGALTMGFWQNKNGQAIIGSSSGLNCQALRTWLNGFNPFKDLTATNCTGVKSYITNIIKAANASGASMNAMLKGQMLATALDVYFFNIGGRTIDLTKVCKNIGGGCTIFEDVSSVFGGATSMTISDMLAYAASQSNVGGSLWYGNVKFTQELAKDAFDAINNRKVFAP